MLPLLRQGKDSVALVKPAEKLKRGDILLYQRANGQYVLHRLVRVCRDGTLWFSGDNHLTVEKGIAHEQIIASVTAVFRGENRKECTSFGMLVYAKMITCTLFRGGVVAFRRMFFRKR